MRPEKDIANKRNIFTVKSIKCLIQEVVADSFAAPNLLTVAVARSPQHCSARLNKQHELESACYVDARPSEEKEQKDVEKKTSTLCRLSVKTSRLKGRDIFGFFSFLHFRTYVIGLSTRLVSYFSKLGTLYEFFLIVFFASCNFVNLIV